MYRISIVEDDGNEKAGLERLILEYEKEKNVSFFCDTFTDAASFLAVGKRIYDIVLMDIGLPDMAGTEAARRFREDDKTAVLIFVTGMANYAVKGYEAGALDFIVKPARKQTLYVALDRAIRLINRRRGVDISVGSGGELNMLHSSSVRYVDVRDHLLTYHTDVGELTEFGSMRKPEKLLAPHGFFRCGNNLLINLKFVESVGSEIVRIAGTELPVARSRSKALIRALNEYMGE